VSTLLRLLDLGLMLNVLISNAIALADVGEITALGYGILIIPSMAVLLDATFLVIYLAMAFLPISSKAKLRGRSVEAMLSGGMAVTLFVLGVWSAIQTSLGYSYAPLVEGYSLRFVFSTVMISRVSVSSIFVCFAVCEAAGGCYNLHVQGEPFSSF
jgi:hypothetical protein